MKKLIVGIIVSIGFNTFAFAIGDTTAKSINYFDGFYTGIGVGINNTSTDANALATNVVHLAGIPEPFITISVPLNPDLGGYMAAGEAFVGFGKSFNIQSNRNNFYLGLELFGKLTPIHPEDSVEITSYVMVDQGRVVKTADDTLEIELKNNYSLGGEVRFGYLLTPKTMIYFLAGVDVAEFSYNINNDGPNFTPGDPNFLATGNFVDESSEWKLGIMPGIGIETMLTDNFSLRAQCVYSFYGDINVDSTHTITLPQLNLLTETNSGSADNISRWLFTIDLAYHFRGV